MPGVLHIEIQPDQGFQLVRIDCAPGTDRRQELARAVVEAGFGLRELRSVSRSLEDVFIQLVTSEPAVAEASSDGPEQGQDPKPELRPDRRPAPRPRDVRPERRPGRPGRKGGSQS